jgi:argininosuccinate synthase
MTRIVLAYSGGLDTSIAIPWLAERFGAEIVTLTLDLGQDRELVAVRERALALGAVRAHVIDAKEEFGRDYILPSLHAGAVHERLDAPATSLGRPLIAKRLVEVAQMEAASAVATGCVPGSPDDRRLASCIFALDPSIDVVTVTGLSRGARIEYANARGIPVLAADVGPFCADSTLWGRTAEWVAVGESSAHPVDDVYTLTRAAEDCPDEPAYVDIEFKAGVPIGANGIEMPLLELIESLDTIAGAHGVGRVETVQRRQTASATRVVFEAPAATLLHAAHKELEAAVVPRELELIARDLGGRYADLLHEGLWFSQTREALDGFFATIRPRITGVVRLMLFKGDCRVVTRNSPFSLSDGRDGNRDLEVDRGASPRRPPHRRRSRGPLRPAPLRRAPSAPNTAGQASKS